jgi:hypothetical protein
LPGFRPFPFPRFGLAGGGVRPGWSSIDGGNEEFSLFREASRSKGTDHHDQDNLVVIKPARWAGPGRITGHWQAASPSGLNAVPEATPEIALPVPARGCWVIP